MSSIHEKIENAVSTSQHTQRNWDLNHQLSQKDVDLLIHAVTQCPSKQNFAFYKVHVIFNRDIINKIHENTMGQGYLDIEKNERVECTNPQVLANALFVFEDSEMSNEYWQKWKDRDFSNDYSYQRDRDMAIGIATGYLNIVAAMLDYKTGFCACFDKDKIKEILGLKKDPVLLMGVGYQDPTRDRREHHTEGVIINGRVKEPIIVNIIE